jgi:hypothetical protein
MRISLRLLVSKMTLLKVFRLISEQAAPSMFSKRLIDAMA